MKTKHTSHIVVPIQAKDLQREYALTPAEAKQAVTKLRGLYAKHKPAGKITCINGRFNPSTFN